MLDARMVPKAALEAWQGFRPADMIIRTAEER
jgi:hypothetical protein